MSILVDASTRVLVQGLTGSQGRFHGLRNRAYGTAVVAGVTPGKGGTDVEGIPVFDTVAEAVAATAADASLIFVPPRGAAGAVVEAADAGIGLEKAQAVDEARARHRVAPDADTGGLADTVAGQLVQGLVGEGAGPANHTHRAPG